MATFIVLLTLHVVLLLYWSVIVLFLLMAPLFLLALLIGQTNLSRVVEQLSVLAHLDLGRRSFWGLPDDWFWFLGWDYSDELYVDASMRAFKATMDLVANGIRIAFALVFLSSFVFRPLIQEPISRLWYGAMDSGKPVFTTLFGLLGAVVAAARVVG